MGSGIKNSVKLQPLEGTLNLGSNNNHKLEKANLGLNDSELQMELQASHPYKPTMMLQDNGGGIMQSLLS